MQTEALYQAVLAAITQHEASNDPAEVARLLTNILVAFATLVRGPDPVVQSVAATAIDFPPPVGAIAGYWVSILGSRRPIWIETPLRAQAPQPEVQVASDSQAEREC